MRPLTFWYEIECLSTFILNIFWNKTYFWRRSTLKWVTLPFLYVVIFQKCQSLEAGSSSPRGDRHMRPLTFWYKIECLIIFIKKKFWNKAYFAKEYGKLNFIPGNVHKSMVFLPPYKRAHMQPLVTTFLYTFVHV